MDHLSVPPINVSQIKKIVLLASSIAIAPFAAADSKPTNNSENPDSLTRSTASRINSERLVGSSPLLVITRKEIEQSGENSAADLLRHITLNSAGSFRPQSGSSIQSVAELDIHGIGSQYTLILIDGRRMTKSPFNGRFHDLTSIALASIERIEILPKGASSLYGGDAVSAVVNIITRTSITGVEVSLRAGNVSLPGDGGDRDAGSILFGTSDEKKTISGGASWNNRDIIFQRDYYYNSQGASFFGNNYSTLTDGFDNFDWRTIPNGSNNGACDFDGSSFFTLGSRCAYDFNQVAADEASSKNESIWLNGSASINRNWNMSGSLSYSKSSSFGRYAPTPDSSYFSTPLSVNSPNNPSNPLGNVYDASRFPSESVEVNWWHRFESLGDRNSNFDSKLLDVRLSLEGKIGNAELYTGIRFSQNKSKDRGQNHLLRSAAASLIESGAYDLSSPFSNPVSVLDQMRTNSIVTGLDEFTEIWGDINLDLFEIKGRPVKAAFGFEYREESIEDIKDPFTEAADVGGSTSNTNVISLNYFNNISKTGDRNLSAVHYEIFAPMSENIGLNLAGRFDDYEGLDSQFSNQFDVHWSPTDSLDFGLSFSEDFQAARLDLLSIEERSFDSPIATPNLVGIPGLVNNISVPTTVTNKFLESEKSESLSGNVNYQLSESNSIRLNYLDTQIKDRARFFNPNRLFILNSVDAQRLANQGLGIFGPEGGRPTNMVTGWGNLGTVDVEVLSLDVNIEWKAGDIEVQHQFRGNKLLSYEVDKIDMLSNSADHPALRMNLKNRLEYNNYSFGWNINMIDGTSGDDSSATWTTHDLQVAYKTSWNGKFTLSLQNAFEKKPPLGTGNIGAREYDFDLYNAYGRISYLEYTHKF
jgi:iron complex outermembrane receptor protein